MLVTTCTADQKEWLAAIGIAFLLRKGETARHRNPAMSALATWLCKPPFRNRPVLPIPETIISALGMAGVGWGPAIPRAACERRLCPVGSTGRRNTLGEHFSRCLIHQGLSGALVELASDGAEFGLAVER